MPRDPMPFVQEGLLPSCKFGDSIHDSLHEFSQKTKISKLIVHRFAALVNLVAAA